MAKDKSKKSNKPADDGDFAKPSDAPASGDGWKITSDETRGALMLITPLRLDKADTKEWGEKEVVVADVVVLNEKKPEKSVEHEEVYIFSGYLKGALRGYIGERRVLGRLQNTKDTTKKKDKGNFYWELEDADADDVAVARAYLEALNDPFGGKGGDEKPAKKSKAAPEPEKKGKKSKAEPKPEKGKKKGSKK